LSGYGQHSVENFALTQEEEEEEEEEAVDAECEIT
jgi:hypothetical protein